MIHDVYFVEPDLGDPLPGEVLVAVPVAVSRCTVRFASEAFPGLDPFSRGLVRFLLAGVHDRVQLAKLLGITDFAYLDLMIKDLVSQGWAHRSGDAVRHTDQAVRHLRDQQATAANQFGHLFYWAEDDGAPLFFAGPLRLEGEGGRVQRLDAPESPSATIDVGTSGRNRTSNCLLPAAPPRDSHPMRRSDATDKSEHFLRRAARSNARTLDLPEALHFSVVPSPPELARLLVRVVPSKKRHQVFVAPKVASPDLDLWLERLRRQDPTFRDELQEQLEAGRSHDRSSSSKHSGTRCEPEVGRAQPIAASPESRTANVSPEQRSPAGAGGHLQSRQELIDILRRRLSKLGSVGHVPLVDDRSLTSATIEGRLRDSGFTWDGPTMTMPVATERAMAAARDADWYGIDDLWVIFAAWVLVEGADCIRDVVGHLPKLPAAVIGLHRDDGSQTDRELRDVITDLQLILEEH